MATLPITYQDQTTNEVKVYQTPEQTNRVILLLPALGVRASYYEGFAKALCESGINVCLTDWRGNGKSNIRPSRKIDFGYKELLKDIGELVDFMEEQFPHSQKYMMGHSLGGQLSSLYSSRFPNKVAGLIHIASCMVFYKGWEGFGRFRVRLATIAFHPLSLLLGHFPGDKLGFGGQEARTLMKDWSYNGKTGKYKINGDDFDYESSMADNTIPVLSMSLKGDDMAPKKAVQNLLDKFSSEAPIHQEPISPEQAGVSKLNHFNWTKNPDYFVELINGWIKNAVLSNNG